MKTRSITLFVAALGLILGSCGSAPMLQCGVNYYENLTNEKADDLIKKLTAENRLQSYTDIK